MKTKGFSYVSTTIININSFSAGIDFRRHNLTYIDIFRPYPLSATIVIFNHFYKPIESLLLEAKRVLKHQNLQTFCLKLSNYE